MRSTYDEIDSVSPAASLQVLFLGTLAIIFGALVAAVVLPAWLPGLTTSLFGKARQVFWLLSRGTAMVGFILLWISMALGILITNRLAKLWPGGPAAFDLHQYTSLLGIGFGLFHALILLGDQYLRPSLFQILVPFANVNYRPVWVGMGQLAFYTWVLLVGSFYVRKQLGNKTWRLIHFVSFLTFALVMAHGILSGTDSSTGWAGLMYWAAGGTTLLLLFYRILTTVGVKRMRASDAKV
jgi:predicted ferric reductase